MWYCYHEELLLKERNNSDTDASFLNSKLSISKILSLPQFYDKSDDFDFEIVNFSF